MPRWTAALVGLAPLLVHDQVGAVDACANGLFLIGMAVCAVTLLRTPPEPALAAETQPIPLVITAPSTR